jgi:regulator of replication initiation timing
MEQNEFDEKIKYAQNIINILQTRLNESVAQNVQLEATTIKLKEELEQTKQEPVDGDSNQTEEK